MSDTKQERPFEIGDTVYLKSGGPPMTVFAIDDHNGVIACTWLADSGVADHSFPPVCLTRTNPGQGGQ